MSLVSELRRRNVLRMAVLYAVAAWLIMQVAEVLMALVGLPAWTGRATFAVLAVAFPIALIFSWFYEITPEGISLEKDVDPAESITHVNGRRVDFVVISLLAAALLVFAYEKWWMRDNIAIVPPVRSSIAVLAFDNLSPDPDNAYFAEGISEEILNVLADIDGLKVASRTSAFSFRGSDTSIPEIARQLGVAHVLEGSVRKQGTRVRISAQLIDAETDAHLWSESYDRNLSDIFVVQEEIARSIAVVMQDVLGVRTVKVDTPTEDLEAYQLFLLGRQLFYQRGPALDGAIAALQTAVDRDPAFVEAWAFLAAAADVAWGYDTAISEENAIALAEEASRRALELDQNQGLAIAVRADLALEVYRDLNKGFDLYHRAVNTDPDDSTSRQWLGQTSFNYGYLSEALVHLERAYELDPLVGIINGLLGMTYLASGQEALARPRLAKAEELGYNGHFPILANHLILSGNYESAIAYLGPFHIDTKDPDRLRFWYLFVEALRDSASLDALVAHLDANPVPGSWGLSLFLAFDLRDRFFERFSRRVAENPRWHYAMEIVWLPGYLATAPTSRTGASSRSWLRLVR